MAVVLEEPTAEAVMAAGVKFDKAFRPIECALEALFRQFPKNTETAHVLLKVISLNDLYSTQIPLYSERIPTVREVVDHIVGLGIDSALDLGSPDLVFNLAETKVPNKKVHYNYSFATKYCNWHRPDLYPIYDSHVDEYLWYLANQGLIGRFDRQELKIYPRLKDIVIEFRDRYGLGGLNFKQIDKFLYFEGGKLLDAKQDAKQLASKSESSQTVD